MEGIATKAHIPDLRNEGRREAMIFFFLALRNLYGFGRKRLADVYGEVQRLSGEADHDSDWYFRVKQYFEGLGVRLH